MDYKKNRVNTMLLIERNHYNLNYQWDIDYNLKLTNCFTTIYITKICLNYKTIFLAIVSYMIISLVSHY